MPHQHQLSFQAEINMTCLIALNPTQLQRLNHHWWWGLCLDQETSPTLYDDAVQLKNDLSLWKNIAQNQTKIMELPAWLRGIYWVFNIGHYRENYYKLYSALSLVVYNKFIASRADNHTTLGFALPTEDLRQGDEMFQNIRMTYTHITEQLYDARQLFADFTSGHGFIDVNFLDINFSDLNENEFDFDADIPSIPPTHHATQTQRMERAIPALTEVDDNFLVTAAILPHLKTLGLENFGLRDTCSLKLLKQSYYRYARQYHPDRTQHANTSEICAQGSAAYETILRCIEKQKENPARLAWDLSTCDPGLTLESLIRELEKTKQANRDLDRSLEKSKLELEKATQDRIKATLSEEKATQSLEKATLSEEKATQSLERATQSLERATLSEEKSRQSLEKTRQLKEVIFREIAEAKIKKMRLSMLVPMPTLLEILKQQDQDVGCSYAFEMHMVCAHTMTADKYMLLFLSYFNAAITRLQRSHSVPATTMKVDLPEALTNEEDEQDESLSDTCWRWV